MVPRTPRTQLATHDVTNQPPPLEDINLFTADAMLKEACAWSSASAYAERLTVFGARVGSAEVQSWGGEANRALPFFRPFDRYGQRIDEVEFHPAYHHLMALGLGAGVAGAAWRVKDSGHVLHAALMFLMGQADYGVCCPMSMTYAAVPALRTEPALASQWEIRATTEDYDARVIPATEKRAITLGMAMTEKQGGSDVRANTTRAACDGDGYLLTGHKWFCSAPMSDAFLTLAYAPDGLTCFLAPRWRADGTRNAIEIQRLKDKLGDRSNASAEIEYRDAYAARIGEEGRGIKTILAMVQLTRLDCIIGAASQMRQAGALAAWHAQHRAAFQKKLIDQPLMRAVLADLALDVEAGVALAFRLAQALDRGETALLRIGLPLAKYLLTKRAPVVVAEAMECQGGAGYGEDGPMPRLFRQSPLNGIWEGSGNVIALDMLRALSEPEPKAALLAELGGEIEAAQLLATPIPEPQARRAIERLALTFAAAVLTKHAPNAVSDGFITRRLKSQSLTFGAGAPAINEAALIARLALAAG
jgi:putative acyl-CoA dehydrogenase